MNLDRNKTSSSRIIITTFDGGSIGLDAEELLKQTNNLGIFFIDGLGIVIIILNGGNGRRGLGIARSETEFREGLLAAAGGFVENGTVNFGDYGVVVIWAMIGKRRTKRERKEFGLREKTEVDERERLDVKELVVVVGRRRIHGGGHIGIAISLRRLCEFEKEIEKMG